MKRKVYTIFVLTLLVGFGSLQAQDQVTLQFTGRNQDGMHVQLSRILVENTTQHWQEVLYYPDTTLILGQTGIGEIGQSGNGVRLFQNVPNPFDGVTDITLYLPEASDVRLEICDLNGKVTTSYQGSFDPGCHQFRARLASPQTYLLQAHTGNGTFQIKMLNTGNSGQNRMEYIGKGNALTVEIPQNEDKGNSTMPFHYGDIMSYTGFAQIGSQELTSTTITKAQYNSELIPLTFTLQPFYCGIDSVTDYDGNTYATVEIGSQCWMKENLRTTHFTDGTAIVNGTTASETEPYRYYTPGNNSGNVPLYGYLYNWEAVMHGEAPSSSNPSGVQGICPGGWHVPSSAEWLRLINYVSNRNEYWCGGDSTHIAKALASNQNWIWYTSLYNTCIVGYNPASNNTTGFTALPAGTINAGPIGNDAYFQSSTSLFEGLSIGATNGQVTQGSAGVCSVRCLLDHPELNNSTAVVPVVVMETLGDIISTTASCESFVISTGGMTVTARGVCWSTSPHPTVSDSHTTDGSGTGRFISDITGLTPGTTYYVRAYATNNVGTGYGEEHTFTTYHADSCGGYTVTDYDGNVYHTVPIGLQCWMRENLRTTHFADGTTIAPGINPSTTTPYLYSPGGHDSEVPTYGYLYNWAAAMHGAASSEANPSGVQGVCPTGWHVPSDAEWQQLNHYVSSQNEYSCGGDSSHIAKALASTKFWLYSDNECAVGNNPKSNNATGFSALPAGYNGGAFFFEWAIFWSTSQPQPQNENAHYAGLSSGSTQLNYMLGGSYAVFGLQLSSSASVRCLKD